MPHDARLTAEETAILNVVQTLACAVRQNDVEAFLACCSPKVVAFDLLPPLKHQGADEIRRTWALARAPFEGPIDYEIHELEIVLGGDVAFCRSLNSFGGVQRGGDRVENNLCSTLGLRKIEGQWKLIHQHVAVPFDMATDEALLQLDR